jgi:hypothetical protein
MSDAYNPIVRTFCRLRAGLIDGLGVARHEVRPGTPLEDILPVERRREVWGRLQRQGLRLPALELSERDFRLGFWTVLRATVSAAVYLRSWYALFLALPLAVVVNRVNRRRAVHFPLGLRTVGEMVIFVTSFNEHKDGGYRWTRNEIALKVRMTVAESVGLPLDAVRPETRLADL